MRPQASLLFSALLLLPCAMLAQRAHVYAAPARHGPRTVAFAFQEPNQPAHLTLANATNGRVLFADQLPPSQNGTLDAVDMATSQATGLVYAALENASGVVTALDPQRGSASAFFTLPNGDVAGQLALSGDGGTLYIGGESNDYIVDAKTGDLELTAPGIGGFQTGFHQLAASPNRPYLYSTFSSGYTVLDAATFEFAYQVTINDTPLALAVSKNGTLLYLAGYSGNLEVADLAARKIVRVVHLIGSPDDLVYDDVGERLYVATLDGVQVIDARTYRTMKVLATIDTPVTVAVDPSTHVCFVASTSGLWRIDPVTLEAKQLYTSSAATVQGVSGG